MPSPLRFIPNEAKLWTDPAAQPIAIAEVTTRTVQGRFLLKPTPRHRSLMLGVLGRAQERYRFTLYGYAFLSNHYSLLIGVRDPQQLASIMGYINSNIARELGRKEHSNWRDKFWSRRHRAILVLSDDDLLERLRYLLANGTKENLVRRPERWPGAHCAHAFCSGQVDQGAWVDRTQLRLLRASAGASGHVSESEVTTWYPVQLSAPPAWARLSSVEQQAKFRALCHEISRAAAEQRVQTRAVVVGLKRLLRYSPHHRPERLSKSPAPPVHARKRSITKWFRGAYRCFVASYQEAHRALGSALKCFSFPEGGHPPTRLLLDPLE